MNQEKTLVEPVGVICVLDIETAPDPEAIRSTRQRSGELPAALHRVTDASLLKAREDEEGNWKVTGIVSVNSRALDEDDLLRRIDHQLATALTDGGTLVTYNGGRHDIPFLQRRAARYLMFDLPGISTATHCRHLDVMTMAHARRDGRWSELRYAAQALGIPTAHQVSSRGMGTATAGVRKGQVDVALTYLVLLYELSILRRNAGAVVSGWRALGEYLANTGPHGDHLAQFRRHPLGGSLDAA